jgi:hypothetical protein
MGWMTKTPERRHGNDRRKNPTRKGERRKQNVPVVTERRSGVDRRGPNRRSGRERRKAHP